MIWILILGIISHHGEEAMLEHDAKNAAGFLATYSVREILNDINAKSSILVSPFGEYKFLDLEAIALSVKLDIPFGFIGNNFYFSDIVATLRGTFDIEVLSLTPMLSIEFPTGNSYGTSGHFSLLPATAFHFLIPGVFSSHIHGILGLKIPAGGEHEDSNAHSHGHTVNYIFPHSEKELFSHIGATFYFLGFVGLDIRPHLFLENMKNFVVQPQVGLVVKSEPFLRVNLYGFWASGGVRKGYGGGVLAYLTL